MKPEQFDKIAKNRMNHCNSLLTSKSKEYSRNGDRLWNFKLSAKIQGITQEEALRGMMVKHWVSVLDLISDPQSVTTKLLDDKISDVVNYAILLEACLLERQQNSQINPTKFRNIPAPPPPEDADLHGFNQ